MANAPLGPETSVIDLEPAAIASVGAPVAAAPWLIYIIVPPKWPFQMFQAGFIGLGIVPGTPKRDSRPGDSWLLGIQSPRRYSR